MLVAVTPFLLLCLLSHSSHSFHYNFSLITRLTFVLSTIKLLPRLSFLQCIVTLLNLCYRAKEALIRVYTLLHLLLLYDIPVYALIRVFFYNGASARPH
jgi:hypothetical protein